MHRSFTVALRLGLFMGIFFLVCAMPLRVSAQGPFTQPQINKQFASISIVPGTITQLTVKIFNENSFGLVNAAWTDTMPGQIRIANPANIVNTCGGAVTAVPGTNVFSLSGGSVPAKPAGGSPGECAVTIDVTSTVPGNHINTIPVGGLTANDATTGLINLTNEFLASATLQVSLVQPPSLNKSFTPNTVWTGQSSQLEINILNNEPVSGGVTLTQVTLTDNLPANVVVASTPAASLLNCGGTATVTAVSGAGSVTLNNASIAPGATCRIRVNVVSTVQGAYSNVIPAGPGGAGSIRTQQGVTNTSLASANLNVQAIGILKDITPASIPAGGLSTLTLTLRNPTNSPYTGVDLTDNLPAGMTIAASPAPVNNCGGTLTAVAGTQLIHLEDGTLAASASPPTLVTCTIIVPVTTPANAPTATLTNTIPAGGMTTNEGISNPVAVSDTLAVQAGLTGIKAFSPASVSAGGVSIVTITLRNHTAAPFTGVSLTDTLPANLTVTGAPASPQCGGTITNTATSVTISGGTIPAAPVPPGTPGTCTITFQVTSSVAATYTNTIPVNDIATNQGVRNLTAITSSNSLVVTTGAVPVTLSKSFSPTTIASGGNTRIRIDFTAPADTNLTNVSLTDRLPTGVTISNSTPASKSASCIGGTLSAVTGADVITWTGGTINAGQQCRIDVYVTSNTPGAVTNTITPADITNDQNRTTTGNRTSGLTVTSLSMSKAFFPATVNPNGLSRLTITLTNTNTAPLINASLSDPLPGTTSNGVVVAPAPNAVTTCGAGVITASPGTQTISMSNGTIPAQVGAVPGICTISVDVQGKGALASHTNTIPTNNVLARIQGTSTDIRPIAQAQSALTIGNLSIRVVKGFNPLLVYGGGASTLSVELRNPNSATLSGIAFTDNMPAGMIIADPPLLNTGTCGGTLIANAGEASFSFSGGTLPANTNCTLTLRATMTVNGNLTNSIPAGAVTTFNGVSNPDPADATLTNLAGASVSKAFMPNPILAGAGNYSILTITIRNTSGLNLTGMGLIDTLPGVLPNGLAIAGAPAPVPSTSCTGGTLIAVPGTQLIQLGGASLANSEACLITVPVTSLTAGVYTNTISTDTLTSDQGISNSDPTTDALTVIAPASLGDLVWNDLNANGLQDSGESGVNGVTVNLYRPGYGPDGTPGNADDGDIVSSDVTAGSGLYLFDNLEPGDYYVDFIPPAGYSLSPQDQGNNNALDSDANTATGETVVTTLVAGENDLTWDAGLYQLTSLGDLAWHDLNANGLQDSGEAGIDGVTVNLYRPGYGPDGIPGNADDGSIVATDVTSGGGLYLFDNLLPGSYVVEFVTPAGYSRSPQNQGSDDALDSDVDSNTGRTAPITIASHTPNLTVDAGFYQLASFGDFVWYDDDGDGVQDAGESGIPGVTVYVDIDGSGTFNAGDLSDTTDVLGDYLIANIPPGIYDVRVHNPPAGYVQTYDLDGTGSANQAQVSVTSGQTRRDVDFGYQPVNASGLSKTIVDSNEASTQNPSVAIGEIVTYRINIIVPPGVFADARLVDTMQRGLSYMDCVEITADNLTTSNSDGFSAICSSPAVDNAGGSTTVDEGRRVTFEFETLTNNTGSDQTLLVTYRAVVLDSATNISGVNLGNNAHWTWGSAGSLGPSGTMLTVAEPDISILKSANASAVSVGSEITITLTIQHTAQSETNAYDVVVTDTLPAELQYVPGSLECASGAQDADVTCAEAGGAITAEWSAFTRNGGNGQVTFRVRVISIPPGGITNIANVAWTSLPGDISQPQSPINVFSTERFYDPASQVDVYGTSHSLTLGAPNSGGVGGGSNGKKKSSFASTLPDTGFAPGRTTDLLNIPREIYSSANGVTVEIPSLGIKLPVVGVPLKNGTWNVSWLGKQAGWLEGSAFPSWNGNSVLTGHVYLSNGLPGPFVNLGTLQYGDKIIIRAYGQKYTFEVRENAVVQPDDLSLLRHEEKPWLTLVTCKEYDEKTNIYRKRVVVRAVLVSVVWE